MFNLLRNHQTVFHTGYTVLHFHQQCLRLPIFSHPHPHLFCCFDHSHLSGWAVVSHCVCSLKKKSTYLAESWHTGPFGVAHGFSRCGAQARKLRHENFLTPSRVGSQFSYRGSNLRTLHCKVDSFFFFFSLAMDFIV